MRWSVVTSQGTFYVYYGDASTSFQSGTGDSGINMVSPIPGANVETPELGPGTYVTWSDLLNGTGGVSPYDANATVKQISLVVDAGYTGTQIVKLTGVQITDNGATSTYTPGQIPGSTSTSTSTGPWVSDNSAPAWLYLAKVSGNAPAAQVDESIVTDTQGDSGGQFRTADGFYIYNFPVSQLTDLSAQYQIGISFNSNGSNPAGVVQFGIK